MANIENITEVLQTTLNGAIDNTVTSTQEIIPGLIAALIIFIIGWIIAIIIAGIFRRILNFVRLEEYLKTHRIHDALGRVRISDVLVKLLKYYIILVFVQQAFEFVQLGVISAFLTYVIFSLPLIIAAILVIVVAALLGEYVKHVVMDLNQKSPTVVLLARTSKLVILAIGVIMALATAKIDTSLISTIFVVVLQAMVFGIALAVGIAFGLGGQKDAQDMISKGRKHLKI